MILLRFAFTAAKFATFAFVVLLISQIPVGQKRITDYVWQGMHHSLVQTPVSWVAKRFNFVNPNGEKIPAERLRENYKNASRPAEEKPPNQTTGTTQYNESDRHRLSGLLKSR